MILKYHKEKPKMILYPIFLRVEKGTTYETTDKTEIKLLKEQGFLEVKPKKEGDE